MPRGVPPPQIKPESDDQYLEEMTKAVFRSGFSWQVVENKWPNFKTAFENFSIDAVASFDELDVERLLSDEGIVRNGRKIEATLHNARTMGALREEYGSFHGYLRSMDDMPYSEIAKDLQKRFSHLGRTGTYTFLWCVAEKVPDWEER
jgi:3-methyladenine DNA glycosylase Tag